MNKYQVTVRESGIVDTQLVMSPKDKETTERGMQLSVEFYKLATGRDAELISVEFDGVATEQEHEDYMLALAVEQALAGM